MDIQKIPCGYSTSLSLLSTNLPDWDYLNGVEEIVGADEVEGVPVLMLANKQDLPQAQKVEDIKEVFNKIAERLDAQDSRALPVSALSG